MAVVPCSVKIQECRVELVQVWSKHVTSLLELLFQVGAVTDEDVSLVRGVGSAGERNGMRTLLDVLYGRGEEACRAFYHVLPRVNAEPALGTVNASAQHNMREHLQKHKDILARQHRFTDYLNIRGQDPGGTASTAISFTDITFSRQVDYAVPSQYQHEVAVVGDAFRGLRQQGEICVFGEVCQNLLSIPGVRLLSGVAGSGKTTVVRRLIQEWAIDTDSKKIVLSLSFRELNLISEPQSLQELLSVHYSHLKPILPEILALNSARILLILDGLDECCFPLDFVRTPKCSDTERVLPVGAMVVNLIKGNLLPGISILLTSRPHAVSKVPLQLVSLFFSVLGFSPAQQQHYFEQNCNSAQAGAAVMGYVSSHEPLLLMCHIPAFCWIVSTALRDGTSCLSQDTDAASAAPTTVGTRSVTTTHSSADPNEVLRTSQNSAKPITITEIYCSFLKSILAFHGEGREEGSCLHRLQDFPHVLQNTRPMLRDLGALAFKGLLERRFIFDRSDLGSFSLDCSELSRVFLVEILKEDRASLTYENSFHFIHTSVQEFLAALYYVLESLSGSDPFSGLKSATVLLPSPIHKCLSSIARKLHGPTRLLRRHVKKALHWSERHQSGHMDLFCRFVSGLLVPRTRFILNGLFPGGPRKPLPCSSSSLPPPPPFLLDLLQSQLQCSSLSPERQINVCHCLFEAQDPGLSQRLQGWLTVVAQQVSDQCASVKRDWSELAFLLQLRPDLQTLSLDAQELDAEGLRRLLPVLPLFCTLSLGQNPLGPDGAAVLSLALRSSDCRIERLWVVGTGLGCEGLKILTEALKDNRTVNDLRMAINQIGDMGAGCLAELLRTNRTLKDIRLRDNQVTDKGAELLMAALTENTTLEYLWMFDNKLSKEGVKKLKDFAKCRPSLDIKVCI